VITSLVLKATAILLIGFAAAHLARHVRASVRHAILVAMFAVLAALPIATIALPAFTIGVPMNRMAAQDASADVAGAPVQRTGPPPAARINLPPEGSDVRAGVPIATLLAYLWLAGAMVFLASLAIGIWRVHRLRLTALPSLDLQSTLTGLGRAAGVRADVDLLIHEQLAAPVACGIVRAAIIVPPDAPQWSESSLHRALVHELEHVKRRDWLIQIFARAVCAAYWFHPLAWIAHRRLRLFAEHACDDAVVALEDGASYADQLVALARRMAARPPVAALGMAQRSDLAARVRAVLDPSKPRGRAGLTRGMAVATVAAMLLAALAPLTIVAAGAGAQLTSQDERRPSRTHWRDRALLEAIDDGNIQDVRELLDEGANVNAVINDDGTPLIVAAREGQLQIVQLLLDRGADPNLAVAGDGAPIIMAAREGHARIVEVLLDRGADVELVVPEDENALIQASGEGHLEVVKLLVARGANVNARALANRHYEAVGTDELGRRRTYDTRVEEWRTPLSMATRGGHTAVVEFLRAAGAVQ
jgi:beta-lactamase regulating signal transducer with metallopeptidase domain